MYTLLCAPCAQVPQLRIAPDFTRVTLACPQCGRTVSSPALPRYLDAAIQDVADRWRLIVFTDLVVEHSYGSPCYIRQGDHYYCQLTNCREWGGIGQDRLY